MPSNRPKTDLLKESKIGAEQEQAEVGNGYYTSQCQSFFNVHGLQSITFFNLEAIEVLRLCEHDLPAGGRILWM